MSLKPVAIVGASGRMSVALQQALSSRNHDFKLWSSRAPSDKKIDDFFETSGVIDFSSMEASKNALALAVKAKVPYVCGTTGWPSFADAQNFFKDAAKVIPILWDSNHSRGVEILCQQAALFLNVKDGDLLISETHHKEKKDSPSGTALKIKARMLEIDSKRNIAIESFRIGEVPGEHTVRLTLQDETLELKHKAASRRPFAEGAISAWLWLQQKKPGLYSMRDLFSC